MISTFSKSLQHVASFGETWKSCSRIDQNSYDMPAAMIVTNEFVNIRPPGTYQAKIWTGTCHFGSNLMLIIPPTSEKMLPIIPQN